MIQTYKDLIVWQKAEVLVRDIYRLTKIFPRSERGIFVDQMRRAALSIVSNIAEGKGRPTRKAYAQFITIAYGSAVELEVQITLAGSLGFISREESVVVEDTMRKSSECSAHFEKDY